MPKCTDLKSILIGAEPIVIVFDGSNQGIPAPTRRTFRSRDIRRRVRDRTIWCICSTGSSG
jgi:hypothetical protein